MTVIPNFILKRMYRTGSLRRLPEGIGFDIVNNLGPGQISQVNCVRLDGQEYPPNRIFLLIDGVSVPADTITEENPATFFLNQVITCLIQGAELAEGAHELTLDLVSREAGKVTLSVKDTLSA